MSDDGSAPRLPLPPVPARVVVHQQGVFAVLALVALGLRDGGDPLAGLALRPGWPVALAAAVAGGVAVALLTLALARLPAVGGLAEVERELTAGWTRGDAVVVALASGLAEEALMRAFLQPLAGIWLTSALFGLLHVFPDRRAWAWPVAAAALGVGLGVAFEAGGWPAAAAGHTALNLAGLEALRRT